MSTTASPCCLTGASSPVGGRWYEHRAHRGGAGTHRCLSVEGHHHLGEVTEKDVLDLDYDKRHRLLHLGTACGAGDLLRGPRLVHAVKGAGPAASLEAVHDGRAPDPGPRRPSLRSPAADGVLPRQLVLPHTGGV